MVTTEKMRLRELNVILSNGSYFVVFFGYFTQSNVPITSWLNKVTCISQKILRNKIHTTGGQMRKLLSLSIFTWRGDSRDWDTPHHSFLFSFYLTAPILYLDRIKHGFLILKTIRLVMLNVITRSIYHTFNNTYLNKDRR